MSTIDLDSLSINTIRTLAMDAVQQANSGHPGTPMAMAPVAYTLWQRHLRFDPNDPIWPDRDRFVLSIGHRIRRACAWNENVRRLSAAQGAAEEVRLRARTGGGSREAAARAGLTSRF
jgi:transketolase N-terminal domain/subunit